MSRKTLSSGTLGLKFMQNARAKQLAHVEAEQAHVRDDAEWEVSKEIREGWGLDSCNSNAWSVPSLEIRTRGTLTVYSDVIGHLSSTKPHICHSYLTGTLRKIAIYQKDVEHSIRKAWRWSKRWSKRCNVYDSPAQILRHLTH